jgi:hypothetical protein
LVAEHTHLAGEQGAAAAPRLCRACRGDGAVAAVNSPRLRFPVGIDQRHRRASRPRISLASTGKPLSYEPAKRMVCYMKQIGIRSCR